MSEQPDFDTSRMQEVAKAVRGDDITNPAQKRKRESNDQGVSADGRRSTYKRVSPNSFNSADAFNNNAINESSDGTHMNQQDHQEGVEALQDYSALHQQNSDNHNGSTDHANAPSTAQAALSSLYPPPTMTIPQPTELSFASQATEGDRNQDSFMNDSQQGGDSFMDNSPGGGHSTGRPSGGSKPAVGSEEWHKVRKDNHKEGKLKFSRIHFMPY